MGDEHGISWPDGGMVASDSCSSTRKTRSDKGRRRGIDSATQATEPCCVIEAMLANPNVDSLIRQHEKTIEELEAEVARYKSNIDITEAATGMCGIYAKLEAEVARLRKALEGAKHFVPFLSGYYKAIEAALEASDD